jgi:ActR/RegA family two-component response regulator
MPNEQTQPAPAHPTVLCLDDEPGILRSLVRAFRAEPVRMLTTSDPAEGLAILRREPVRLILTDYRMPAMSGVQFLEQARKIAPDAFRILLTGYADLGAVSNAINQGHIYKVIYKPWNDDDLKLAVRTTLEHYARNLENAALQETLAAQNSELQRLARQLEAQLSEQSETLTMCSGTLLLAQRLLYELPCAVLCVDAAGQIVFANRAAEAWFGGARSPTTPGRALLTDDFQGRLPTPIAWMIRAALDGGGSPHVAGRVTMTQGEPRTLDVRCRKIAMSDQGQAGSSAGVLVHADDVTEGICA